MSWIFVQMWTFHPAWWLGGCWRALWWLESRWAWRGWLLWTYDTEGLTNVNSPWILAQEVGALLKNPQLVRCQTQLPQDMLHRLEIDIYRCVHLDPCYSPLSDLAKQAAGEDQASKLVLTENSSVHPTLSTWTRSWVRTTSCLQAIFAKDCFLDGRRP